MGTKENKELVRRFFEEGVNKRDETAMDEVMAEDFINHAAPVNFPPGREGAKQVTNMMLSAFPDMHVVVEELVAEGDKVAVRVTVSGTHQGMLMGRIAATGKRATWTGIDIWQVRDGRLVASWNQRDIQGMMRQLGVLD